MALSITSLAKATLPSLPVCPPTVPNLSAAARDDLPVPSPSNHLAVPSPNPIPSPTDAAFPAHSTAVLSTPLPLLPTSHVSHPSVPLHGSPDFGKIGTVFKIPPGSYWSPTTTTTTAATTTTTAATVST